LRKAPRCVAELDEVLGHASGQARDLGQQRHRGGVEIDADGVDAVLDHGVQAARQAGLIDVVLILADADGLGLDLDQLRQRVLQPAGDGHGAAQRHVHVRNSREAYSEAE
jgi:hypothetical protein